MLSRPLVRLANEHPTLPCPAGPQRAGARGAAGAGRPRQPDCRGLARRHAGTLHRARVPGRACGWQVVVSRQGSAGARRWLAGAPCTPRAGQRRSAHPGSRLRACSSQRALPQPSRGRPIARVLPRAAGGTRAANGWAPASGASWPWRMSTVCSATSQATVRRQAGPRGRRPTNHRCTSRSTAAVDTSPDLGAAGACIGAARPPAQRRPRPAAVHAPCSQGPRQGVHDGQPARYRHNPAARLCQRCAAWPRRPAGRPRARACCSACHRLPVADRQPGPGDWPGPWSVPRH